MTKNILSKLKESVISIIPIVLIVLILGLTISPLSSYDIIKFLISALLLIIGMPLFTVGAESAMHTMGSSIGSNLSKSRKLATLLVFSFLLGLVITIAEPDLSVLAEQIASINKWLFIFIVALGVGIFLMLAVLRIIFQIKIKTVLIISYLIVFALMFIVPSGYLPISIDSGAITTGPISVPFILAFGVGISAVRSGGENDNDGFGLISLTSVGPLITTLLLCIFAGNDASYSQTVITETQTGSASLMFSEFGVEFLENVLAILVVILPIIVFFFVYNAIYLKFPKIQILKIIVGLVYSFLGIVLFLTGVLTGFYPIASVLGFNIMSSNHNWLIIPISLIVGLFSAFAEPAVHVLNKRVEEITNGIISKNVMMIAIGIGVSLSLVLAILRVIYKIDYIYLILPIYILCIILSIFCPSIFTAIAFDSGGVASGTMASNFIFPLILGVAKACNANIISDVFGTVAFIASLPILIILIIGIIYKYISIKKSGKTKRKIKKPIEIVEFDLGEEWWERKKLNLLLKLWLLLLIMAKATKLLNCLKTTTFP